MSAGPQACGQAGPIAKAMPRTMPSRKNCPFNRLPEVATGFEALIVAPRNKRRVVRCPEKGRDIGNIAERQSPSTRGIRRPSKVEASNSEIPTGVRAGANAVHTVAVYVSRGICSITRKKKSVTDCSIPTSQLEAS
jgi:hypothetical protein